MLQNPQNRDIVVAALRHAAPYVRLFRHKTFVIKAGGEVFADAASTRALIEQVAILHQVGIRTVLVHGGGPQSTRLADDLGIATRMVEGRRVTDARTLEVAAMVLNGQINTQIVAACRQLELPAIGMSGVDAGLIRARKRAPVKVPGQKAPVDYGFVGDIEDIDVSALQTQLGNGLLPIVSPLSADTDGTLLNINADTVAAALASALGAAKLILATGAPGILKDRSKPSSLVSYIDLAGLEQMKQDGSIADGMLPKAKAIDTAIRGGVPRVHVISYKIPDSLLLEIFTNEGTGTLVVENIDMLSKAEKNG